MEENKLKDCPFCGGEAKLTTIGNDYTKKRKAEIKCTQCFTKQITGAIYKTIEWCKETAINKWNNRISNPSEKEESKK